MTRTITLTDEQYIELREHTRSTLINTTRLERVARENAEKCEAEGITGMASTNRGRERRSGQRRELYEGLAEVFDVRLPRGKP